MEGKKIYKIIYLFKKKENNKLPKPEYYSLESGLIILL